MHLCATVTRSTTVLVQSTDCRRGHKQRPRRYPLTWEAEGRSFIFIFMWCTDPIKIRSRKKCLAAAMAIYKAFPHPNKQGMSSYRVVMYGWP